MGARALAFVLSLLCAQSALGHEERVDKIIVLKKERALLLLRKGRVIRRFKVALGQHPVGPKRREGDSKTPEGHYVINGKNAQSRFHLALRISYPSRQDRERAHRTHASPGGDIMIHGLPNRFSWTGKAQAWADWTDGCIAVTNEEIEFMWKTVEVGTPIEIRP